MGNSNKIFNIGLNKCGTKTLSKALDILGFNTAHFIHKGVRIRDIIQTNIHNKRKLLWGIEDYDVLSDFAGQYIFKALDVQYPGSKFILTIRGLDGWLSSREAHVRRNQGNRTYRHNFLEVDRDNWTREYHQVLHEVTKHFSKRRDDLLILNIPAGEKWEKLCPFVGADIPVDAFPNENRRG